MSDISRSEYNELIQKINEIHDMLRAWSRHPNLYPALEPYPKPPWIVTSQTTSPPMINQPIMSSMSTKPMENMK